MKKILIIAPFWRHLDHVGHTRVERMVRWLASERYEVVIVRAGGCDEVRSGRWGVEVTVRDPLGLYRQASDTESAAPRRRPNAIRRAVAYRVFCPDPSIVWARRAARHRLVREHASGASLVVSSSPPESIHIGAARLARALGVGHLVDMRDGWLDEPLRPLSRFSSLRRWRETRLESSILRHASAINVTSDVWKDMLCERLPFVSARVHVVTNTYPSAYDQCGEERRREPNDELILLYAGRFSGSRLTQDPALLLSPLLAGAAGNKAKATVRLIGDLTADDEKTVHYYRVCFAAEKWRIEVSASVPRQQLLTCLPTASGLLLLCASMAAVPSKLYEYIVAGRPIMVVTPYGSATWRICERLEQAYLVSLGAQGEPEVVQRFLAACARRDNLCSIPHQYSEESVSKTFLKLVAGLFGTNVKRALVR